MRRDQVETVLASRQTFLTFAGVETYLYFQQKFPMREMCAFEALDDEVAWQALQDGLMRPVADAAAATGAGLITDCLVWRASSDYTRGLGYDDAACVAINRKAVAKTRRFIESWQTSSDAAMTTPVLLTADIGPRGDGYTLDDEGPMAIDAAFAYHREQILALAASSVDLIAAQTMTSVNEAIGIACAAEYCGVPLVVSPTVETDGRLPDGSSLGEFIDAVDNGSRSYPLLYMVNCSHPSHLEPALSRAAASNPRWLERFSGFRANASTKSHAELDNSTTLDRGDPKSLGESVAALKRRYDLKVVGGCCGTDAEHLRAIAHACAHEASTPEPLSLS